MTEFESHVKYFVGLNHIPTILQKKHITKRKMENREFYAFTRIYKDWIKHKMYKKMEK